MKKKLLLLTFFSVVFASAQFNPNAPWMKDLKKSKTATTFSKSAPGKEITPKYTFKEITDAFDAYWVGKDINQKGSGYKPFMRWRNYWKNFVKPDGYLPTAKELWQTFERKQQFAGPVNPTSDWSAVGPIESNELAIGLPGIGRLNAVAVDPNDANTWYVGAPAGGIWKSTDGGSSWTNLFDEFPQIGVSGIAIDPNDSNTILIATGDDDASDSFSAGVFKSTNGGTSWDETSINPSNQDEFDVLGEIMFDPTDSNIAWVAGSDGLQKSTDGGDNWTPVLTGHITDFKLKPGDPNTVYAVQGETGSTADRLEAQYFKSEDGGDNFTQITSTLPTGGGRMVLGVTPAAPETLYICVADVIGNGSAFMGVFKSTDSGTTFTQTAETDDIFGSSQAWFDFAIAVSPTNADEVYVGVLDLWRSTDGGDDFTRISRWFQNDASYTHADIHVLKFFNDRLYCGSDGGLYVSDDGINFTDFSDGISVTQFYHIGIAKNNAEIIVGGTQDNSGFVYNNNVWSSYSGGDGMDYEIDPNNSNVAYGFSQFGGNLYITTNLGQSVGAVPAPTDGNGATIQGNWITPLSIGADGTVYSAYDIVYRLSGNQWEALSNAFIDDIDQGNKINDLQADPNDPNVIYASDRGFLYRSDDGGETFVTLNPDDSLGDTIGDIAVNSEDPTIVYVTTSFGRPFSQATQNTVSRGVFRLTIDGNSLVSIDDITFDLPADQAYLSIVHQARNANNPIFVGTSLGVYRLDDTLTEWEQYSTNLPNTAVSDLEISPDGAVIVASTYGRGAFVSPIPVELPSDDVRLANLVAVSGTIGCGDVIPSLTVENKGQNAITQIDVTYTINGGTEQTFTYTTNLASEASESFDLPAISGALGEQIQLDASVSIANDAFEDNNSFSANSYVANASGVFSSVFDFESDGTSLFSYDVSGTTPLTPGGVWEIGEPTGELLNTAASGTQVIGTNLDGDYPSNSQGIIFSNCYDLSSRLAPKLSFDMAFELEQNWDYVTVIYTLDGGATYEILGELGSQPNWYNSDRTQESGGGQDCFNCPGAQWTGTNATMTTYTYDFLLNAARGEVDLTNETNIIFGILFQSDGAVEEEGAIIDNFIVEGFVDDDDDDNDGILDVNDNCSLNANADQLDTDLDGEGDACDLDDDNDGIEDSLDVCPLIANPGQEDFDGDGIGDLCDDDIDGDGVPNTIDTCSNTPLGSVVDVDGCAIFSLPADNFSLRTTGESCSTSDNGSVEITTGNPLNYTATLTDSESNVTTLEFSDMVNFENLAAGEYTICITVEGQAGYERCFDVSVTEPEGLSVASKVSSLNNEVTLSLTGGQEYLIELNGKAYITSESEITLPLTQVENSLSVKTDRECQGIHTETIFLSERVLVYPNPISSGELGIYLGSNEFTKVDVSLFAVDGTTILNRPFRPNDGYFSMSMTGMANGIYILNIKTENSLLNYKILKK